MASDAYLKSKESDTRSGSDMPKHKQLIQMLSFRVVPAYYKDIEKVANHKSMTVSKLIRTYIKDGMRRDKELSKEDDRDFRVE